MTVALVLSGGGSKGDFELGAIQYLYRVRNIQPSLIVGTSVGAINGAKLAEGEGSPAHGLAGLERTWLTLDRNDDMWRFESWIRNLPVEVARFVNAAADTHLFSSPPPGLDAMLPRDLRIVGMLGLVQALPEAASLANLEPIRDRIQGRNGHPVLLDTARIGQWAAGNRRLRLAAVSLDSGALRFVTETGQLVERDGSPTTDPQTRQVVRCTLSDGIVASASIGVVFPPVQLGNEWYVDGGHRSVIPVDPVFLPAHGIQQAYLVSASTVRPAPFKGARTLFNIAMRSMLDSFLHEIVHSEISPRGGTGGRSFTVIAPTMEIHSIVRIDPGLIRINADYGWMRADDAVNGRGPGHALHDLSDSICWHRTKIWFIEGKHLGAHGAPDDGEFATLPELRSTLQRLLNDRRQQGGSLPPGADRWAQIGEAHSTRAGAQPMINLGTFPGAPVAVVVAAAGRPVLALQDSLVGTGASPGGNFNDARRVVYSTRHHEALIQNLSGWRVAGRSQLPARAALQGVSSSGGASLLLAADESGAPVCAEALPDGHGFTGWMPAGAGRTRPGGWVTGVSRRPGSFDLFMVGIDGFARTAARHTGQTAWGGWWSLPTAGFVPGSPISAVSRSTDLLDVFAVDGSGGIVTAAWSPGSPNWGGWWSVANGRALAGGHVTAVSCDLQVIDLFVVGTDGTVYRTFWSPSHPWGAWTSLATAGLRFTSGAPLSAVSPGARRIVLALCDSSGGIHATVLNAPTRTFQGFTRIGSRSFASNGHVALAVQPGGEVQACAIGADRRVYVASLPAGSATAWSDWTPLSASVDAPVFIPSGTAEPFQDGGLLRTSDPADEIEVGVRQGVVAADTVEFVLDAGPGIDLRKDLLLIEGAAAGTNRWTITVEGNVNSARNGLYLYQLAGGRVEFARRNAAGAMATVLRVPLDAARPGSRVSFRWVRDR
jgi:predicted acylesterase/phospholipase RssA